MSDTESVAERSAALGAEFDREIRWYSRCGRTNYWTARTAKVAIVVFSLAGGLITLLKGNPALASMFSFVPGAITLFSTELRFQEHANWHYRKAENLTGLRQRLHYELPLNPTVDNVAAISRAKREMSDRMTVEWENRLGKSAETSAQSGKEHDSGDTSS